MEFASGSSGADVILSSLQIRAPVRFFLHLLKMWTSPEMALPHFSCSDVLDTANTVIGLSQISVGGLSSSVVEARQVFKTAILSNADALILAHQHPSPQKSSAEGKALPARRGPEEPEDKNTCLET